MAGCFVSLEGIDGTGKTTQARMLVDALTRAGRQVLHTREPGGTELGRRLRALLLQSGDDSIGIKAEMLLMAADRAQHVDEVIRPALASGKVVVSERYVDSSLAYQSAAGVSMDAIRRVNEIATDGLLPDLTFLFDADPTQAFRQTRSDRIEGRSLEYHRKVRAAFLSIHRAEPARVHLLSVPGMAPDDIHRLLLAKVDACLAKEPVR